MKDWKNKMAGWVTIIALLGFAALIIFIAILLTNAAMVEVQWTRYTYLLTGVETITFTAIGWLFGKEVHREQAAMAESMTQKAMEAKDQSLETMHQAMNAILQTKGAQGLEVFIHKATPSNMTENYTDIDHPNTNDNPNAVVLVTQNWSPGGTGNVYNDHPIGVWFHNGKWSIFNQDKVAMPPGAAFNVMVVGSSVAARA